MFSEFLKAGRWTQSVGYTVSCFAAIPLCQAGMMGSVYWQHHAVDEGARLASEHDHRSNQFVELAQTS